MILKDIARTGISLKITSVVFIILISCISKSFALDELPDGFVYEKVNLQPLSVTDYCLEYSNGCLEEDLESFIDDFKAIKVKSLYCTMSSPFQATEKENIKLLFNGADIFRFSVEGYAFLLKGIKSQWNTNDIHLHELIKDTDNYFILNRETLTLIENYSSTLGKFSYNCALTDFESLAQRLKKYIETSIRKNKI
jgi:hypothetical protein